jgi:excisionase family DNA binding protein
MSDELLTINDAAKRLNVTPLDLRHLLQAKKLPAVEIKGRWRISATALQAFIQRGGVSRRGNENDSRLHRPRLRHSRRR